MKHPGWKKRNIHHLYIQFCFKKLLFILVCTGGFDFAYYQIASASEINGAGFISAVENDERSSFGKSVIKKNFWGLGKHNGTKDIAVTLKNAFDCITDYSCVTVDLLQKKSPRLKIQIRSRDSPTPPKSL